jgi:hypothetical protein
VAVHFVNTHDRDHDHDYGSAARFRRSGSSPLWVLVDEPRYLVY